MTPSATAVPGRRAAAARRAKERQRSGKPRCRRRIGCIAFESSLGTGGPEVEGGMCVYEREREREGERIGTLCLLEDWNCRTDRGPVSRTPSLKQASAETQKLESEAKRAVLSFGS